jgi:hypothetical protein
MSDDLWPVGEENESEFAINIQLVAYNPGKRMAVLRRLEGSLVRPPPSASYQRKTFALVWRRFIKGNPGGFEQTEPVFVRAVKPQDSLVLAVQLRGNYNRWEDSLNRIPREDDHRLGNLTSDGRFFAGHFDWFPGRYTLSLYGHVNRRRVRLSPRGGFTFELSPDVFEQLSPPDPIDPPLSRSVRLMN